MQIEIYWKDERVGKTAPLATYQTTSSVHYSDAGSYFGSMSCLVKLLEIPKAATLREVFALDIEFDPAFVAKYGAPAHRIEIEED